jgi:PTS system N-acetylgalactosamine-specific IIA component
MSDSIAIVLGHADLAAGMISAVHQITGRGDRFVAMSNAGLGAAEIEEQLRELIARTGATVVFTDLPAGSCNFAACRLIRERPDLVVVSGVNLPALLFFATHDELPPAQAAEQAVSRAVPALRVVAGKAGAGRGH